MGDIGIPSRCKFPEVQQQVYHAQCGDDSSEREADDARRKVVPLLARLHRGSVLFPKSQGYIYSVSVGNLRYRLKSPAAVVHAVTVWDVVAAVRFCSQEKLKLNIRSGGHSNAAHCLNDNGIVLDMRMLKKVVIQSNQERIYVSGGAVWKDVYKELHDKDPRLIVVGGQCPTVGVSGFLLGGGISPFSRSYGLGIDNIEAIQIVKANGELAIVSAENHPDLFWALRGGGGGNFGVATGFFLKLHKLNHPEGLVTCGTLGWSIEDSTSRKKFIDTMRNWDQSPLPAALCGDALWRYRRDRESKEKKLWAEITTMYNGGKSECISELAKVLRGEPDVNTPKEMKFYEWEVGGEAFANHSRVHHHHSSVIIEKEHEPESERGGCHVLWDHLGEQTGQWKPDETAFPWRTGEYALSMKSSWDKEEKEGQMIREVQRLREELKKFAIGGKAAYVNYIDNTLTDWWDAYYDANYKRLRQLKEIHDPEEFFEFQQSIRKPKSEHPAMPAIPSCNTTDYKAELEEKNDSVEDVIENTTQNQELRSHNAPAQSAYAMRYGSLRSGRWSAVHLKRYVLNFVSKLRS
ncbi:CAZyme family AA7 [Aspergillus niger]|uniref:FAD-binding PCMH-type domain-containing protein n=1 Tax=Aspergillus niger TaxID=5061 RepID=A0A9W6A9W2_ASPNG|nr:CAZyme family AA7 [Aspergillus niger]KAI2855149.1 CAZyme family AA7 [Aspergillus niger]KAI2946856.1 CAZyme family AA7 [Aspergillus niger]KAI2959823.1 CAZyme family AA7 [Aspergillus niger]KAI2965310.1 CAZyme family AA7 [Aspergillus niger]